MRDTPRSLPQPARFVLAGGIAALVNFVSRIAFNVIAPYAGAIVAAYFAGMATAFLLNRRYVFPGSTNRLHRQIAWFVAVNLLALLQTLLVSLVLADLVFPHIGMRWHPREVAHAVGIVLPIFTSYVGHKRWTFR